MTTVKYWTIIYNLPTGIFTAIVPYTTADCERDAVVAASVQIETRCPSFRAIYDEHTGYADGLVQHTDTAAIFYPKKITLK